MSNPAESTSLALLPTSRRHNKDKKPIHLPNDVFYTIARVGVAGPEDQSLYQGLRSLNSASHYAANSQKFCPTLWTDTMADDWLKFASPKVSERGLPVPAKNCTGLIFLDFPYEDENETSSAQALAELFEQATAGSRDFALHLQDSDVEYCLRAAHASPWSPGLQQVAFYGLRCKSPYRTHYDIRHSLNKIKSKLNSHYTQPEKDETTAQKTTKVTSLEHFSWTSFSIDLSSEADNFLIKVNTTLELVIPHFLQSWVILTLSAATNKLQKLSLTFVETKAPQYARAELSLFPPLPQWAFSGLTQLCLVMRPNFDKFRTLFVKALPQLPHLEDLSVDPYTLTLLSNPGFIFGPHQALLQPLKKLHLFPCLESLCSVNECADKDLHPHHNIPVSMSEALKHSLKHLIVPTTKWTVTHLGIGDDSTWWSDPLHQYLEEHPPKPQPVWCITTAEDWKAKPREELAKDMFGYITERIQIMHLERQRKHLKGELEALFQARQKYNEKHNESQTKIQELRVAPSSDLRSARALTHLEAKFWLLEQQRQEEQRQYSLKDKELSTLVIPTIRSFTDYLASQRK